MSGYARGPSATTVIGRFISNMQHDEKISKAFSKIELVGTKRVKLSHGKNEMVGGKRLPEEATSFEIALETPPLHKQAPKKNTRRRR